eukprot:2044191-Amphidinium_carterae.1
MRCAVDHQWTCNGNVRILSGTWVPFQLTNDAASESIDFSWHLRLDVVQVSEGSFFDRVGICIESTRHDKRAWWKRVIEVEQQKDRSGHAYTGIHLDSAKQVQVGEAVSKINAEVFMADAIY